MAQGPASRLALSLIGLSALIQVASMAGMGVSILQTIGVKSVFDTIRLQSPVQVALAMLLTFPLTSLFLQLGAGYLLPNRWPRAGSALAIASGALSLIGAWVPSLLGFQVSVPTQGLLSASGLLAAAAGGYAYFRGAAAQAPRPLLSTSETAYTAVFSALTAVVTATTGVLIPSPTGGYTHVGDAIIFIAALLFGSKVGGATGIIGAVAADVYVGYSRWFVSIPAHGVEGFVAGLARDRRLPVQVALMGLSGFLMATTYFTVNVFIKGYPVALISYLRDLFGQALVSLIIALVLTRAVKKILPIPKLKKA